MGEVGQVVDLERRQIEALARQILPVLLEHGSLVVNTDKVHDVERWRKAARRAGRMLGWHVRTGVIADGARVWAASNDFPVTEADRKAAAKRVEDFLFGPPEPASTKPVRLVPVDYR